ncbi:MAG: hypothetical protein KDA20_02140 [Phycisphaerales bacterium]|nr:hypothetical protein [Phycisphaerales bacterium]
MNVQGIGAGSAGMYVTGGVKPHSDGLEPPDAPEAQGAQTNAAVSSVEATEPRRESQSHVDVYA